jgi:hypothetical protein
LRWAGFSAQTFVRRDRITSSVEITLTNEFHENDDSKSELVEYTFIKKVIYEKIANSLTIFLKPELIISYVRNGGVSNITKMQIGNCLDNWTLNIERI